MASGRIKKPSAKNTAPMTISRRKVSLGMAVSVSSSRRLVCHRFQEPKLRFAYRDEVAVAQFMPLDSDGVHEYAVGAGQVFDGHGASFCRNSRVLAANEVSNDLDVAMISATDRN